MWTGSNRPPESFVMDNQGRALSTSPSILLLLSNDQGNICKQSVSCNNANHDTKPSPLKAGVDAEHAQNILSTDLSNGIEDAGVVALVLPIGKRGAVIYAVTELVDHHALEDVGLVIDVVEDVSPEVVENSHGNQETVNAHPETVGKGGDSKSDNEDVENGRDENNQGLGSDEVQEKPSNPLEEAGSARTEVGQPIFDDREDNGDQEEERQADEEVGDHEGKRADETVGTLLLESVKVFQEGGHVRDSHKGHERTTEENGVGERLNILLFRTEAKEDSTHQDCQAEIHGNSDAVGHDIAV